MPETIGGLPLHPLVVHAVVVLLPLAAAGVLVLAAVPRLRRPLGVTVLVITAVATALVPVAQQSGENLREETRGGRLVARHAELGETLLYFAVPLLAAAVVLWWMGRGDRDRRMTPLSVIVSVLFVVLALAVIVQVVRIGHSGADAVWSGILAAGPTGQQ
jgi:uncharacterized membrane protein